MTEKSSIEMNWIDEIWFHKIFANQLATDAWFEQWCLLSDFEMAKNIGIAMI